MSKTENNALHKQNFYIILVTYGQEEQDPKKPNVISDNLPLNCRCKLNDILATPFSLFSICHLPDTLLLLLFLFLFGAAPPSSQRGDKGPSKLEALFSIWMMFTTCSVDVLPEVVVGDCIESLCKIDKDNVERCPFPLTSPNYPIIPQTLANLWVITLEKTCNRTGPIVMGLHWFTSASSLMSDVFGISVVRLTFRQIGTFPQ